MEFLRWIVGLAITVLLAFLAVMNRAHIDFFWSPLHDSVSLPVYLIILASIAFGFVFGGIVVWFNMGSLRRKKREQKKEIKDLEKEVTKLQHTHLQGPPAKELFTALPPKI